MEQRQKISSEEFRTGPIWQTIFKVSLPVAFGNLVQASFNIVDGVFLSKLSETALTATSLSFSVQMLLVAFVSGLATGMNSVFSRKLGERKKEEAGNILITAYLLCALFSFIYILFGIFLVRPFFASFTDDETVIELGVEYLSLTTILYFPSAFTTMLERTLQATNNSSYSFISHFAAIAVNFVLDPVLIFGFGDYQGLGIRGAALATVISQFFSFVISLYFNLKNNRIYLPEKGEMQVKLQYVKEIYSVALPVTIMSAIGTFMTYGVNKVLISFSPTAVAFFGLYYKLQMFVFMPIYAFGGSLVSLVAYNYGSKDYERAKQFRNKTILVNVGVGVFGMLLFIIIPGKLLSLFNPSEEMIEFGIPSLRIISLIFPIEPVCTTLGFSFQGFGRGDYSLYHSVVRQLFLRVPFCYLFGKWFGLDYVWYSFLLAEVIAFVITISMSRRIDHNLDTYGSSRAPGIV